jgi:hypothetical protein
MAPTAKSCSPNQTNRRHSCSLGVESNALRNSTLYGKDPTISQLTRESTMSVMRLNRPSRWLLPVLSGVTLATGALAQIPEQQQENRPRPFKLSDQRPSGDLLMRLQRNFDRLEEPRYQPHRVFLTNKQSNYWPGDTEGRTVLGLTLLGQATGRKPKHLDAILSLFPERMNERGYFGEIAPDGIADEQQLASHGWVLRGLSEHYLITRDPAALEMIRNVVQNLALPIRELLDNYEIDPAQREHSGGAIGTRRVSEGNWLLSTDTICVFILLDGLVQAYEIEPSEQLKLLIEDLITLFNQVDVRAIKAQTHATMTALRGLLRYYGVTGDAALLKRSEEVFATYTGHGMTETYENYNWFGRPTHTEVCGVIDSLQAALQLWRYTGNPTYLDHAHHIYYNGICGLMRKNGGFGCNNCAGAQDCTYKVEVEEAWWCCTMRAGEGLSRVAESAYHTLGDQVFVTFYADNAARLQFGNEQVVLRQRSMYPYRGLSTIDVTQSNSQRELSLRLFTPSSSQNYTVQVNGQPVETTLENGFVVLPLKPKSGDTIQITFDLKTGRTAPVNEHTLAGVDTVRYGPLVLMTLDMDTMIPSNAKVKHLGMDQFECGGVKMRSVYSSMTNEDVRKEGPERRVMFSKTAN